MLISVPQRHLFDAWKYCDNVWDEFFCHAFRRLPFFKEKSEKKKEEKLVGKVSQGAAMKVYLEGCERHHETAGVLHQKNTVNLFSLNIQWCPTQQPHTELF